MVSQLYCVVSFPQYPANYALLVSVISQKSLQLLNEETDMSYHLALYYS